MKREREKGGILRHTGIGGTIGVKKRTVTRGGKISFSEREQNIDPVTTNSKPNVASIFSILRLWRFLLGKRLER